MDYKSYNPNYDPKEWNEVFRNNILEVNEGKANDFCKAMENQEFLLHDIRMNKSDGSRFVLSVLIDFDSRLYVNGYYDILLEEYIPKNWVGIFDDPLKHVPDNVKQLFE